MATIAELLLQHKKLQAVSDSAALDIELLLCHCLDKDRSYLRAWPERAVPNEQVEQFLQLLERRINGEPVAYIVGERGFWSLDLKVSPSTLIPRPETELLVEKTLQLMAGTRRARVLDLGTGTGAIALALASEKTEWQIVASDIQPDAVLLAQSNRAKYAFDNVSIVQSSWFQHIGDKSFDIIVSNPPYIDPNDQHLDIGDVRFEPRSALVAENNGLADLEQIIRGAGAYLNSSGWLLLEHGYDQSGAVQTLMQQAGFKQVFTEQDLSGWGRITGGQWGAEASCDE